VLPASEALKTGLQEIGQARPTVEWLMRVGADGLASSAQHSPCRRPDPSRALPWFESYADQDRTIRMFLRNAGNEEAMMAPDMIGFMESVV
jgi:hypothetical protein